MIKHVIAVSVAMVGLALAAPVAVAAEEKLSVGVYGGANFSEDFGAGSEWYGASSNGDTGYVLGATVSYPVASVEGLSVQADLNYRRTDLNPSVWICNPSNVYRFAGSDETVAILANVRYERNVGPIVRPYALAGVGYGERQISVHPYGADLTAEESGVVWQAGVGAVVEVSKGVDLDIGYRYFDAPEIQRDLGVTVVTAGGQNHAVLAGVTFKFD
jgi:opacity protein-like surface antigen